MVAELHKIRETQNKQQFLGKNYFIMTQGVMLWFKFATDKNPVLKRDD
jgi:hypothetical protein